MSLFYFSIYAGQYPYKIIRKLLIYVKCIVMLRPTPDAAVIQSFTDAIIHVGTSVQYLLAKFSLFLSSSYLMYHSQ